MCRVIYKHASILSNLAFGNKVLTSACCFNEKCSKSHSNWLNFATETLQFETSRLKCDLTGSGMIWKDSLQGFLHNALSLLSFSILLFLREFREEPSTFYNVGWFFFAVTFWFSFSTSAWGRGHWKTICWGEVERPGQAWHLALLDSTSPWAQ